MSHGFMQLFHNQGLCIVSIQVGLFKPFFCPGCNAVKIGYVSDPNPATLDKIEHVSLCIFRVNLYP